MGFGGLSAVLFCVLVSLVFSFIFFSSSFLFLFFSETALHWIGLDWTASKRTPHVEQPQPSQSPLQEQDEQPEQGPMVTSLGGWSAG